MLFPLQMQNYNAGPPHSGHDHNKLEFQLPNAPQFDLSPEVINTIAQALAQNSANTMPAHAGPPSTRRYFFHAITNAASDLSLSVIKELKTGFKNYIPLALYMHKACQNATHSTNPMDMEIGWTDKGKMRLKQKAMNAAKDYYLTTDKFTEIRENFIHGICKYLRMGRTLTLGGSHHQLRRYVPRFLQCNHSQTQLHAELALLPGLHC
jgi:hypothetical protein